MIEHYACRVVGGLAKMHFKCYIEFTLANPPIFIQSGRVASFNSQL